MTPKDMLAKAKVGAVPLEERIALYRQVLEHPKAKASERAEALQRGLERELEAHAGPVSPELLERVHAAIEALKARNKAMIWPLVNAFFARLDIEGQEAEAVALAFAYLPLETSKWARPGLLARQVPRFFLNPRVQEVACPKTPKWLKRAALLGTALPVRRIGHPYGIPKRANSAKLGGLPGLADPADWPRDPQGRPMQLLAQVASVHAKGPYWPRVERSGVYQFFAAQEAIEALGGPCAVRFQPHLKQYADVQPVQQELLDAFGAAAVRLPSCYHDHDGILALSAYDYRFDGRVTATGKQKHAWDAEQFRFGTPHQIGGHARFVDRVDPRSASDSPELDMLLLQLGSDPLYGMSWGGGQGTVWFFGPSEQVRRGDLSGVRFFGEAGISA